jgi:tryptophan-rich sensory protein
MQLNDKMVGDQPVYVTIALSLLPLVSGFGTSCVVGGVGKQAGESVVSRPPSALFKFVWPILYLSLGASWALAQAKSKQDWPVALAYSSLTFLLCSWIVMYTRQTENAKTYASWILVACVAASFVAFSTSVQVMEASALLGPLIAWLIFALILNLIEVQHAAQQGVSSSTL